jgi:hypothetical protein
MEEVTSLLAFGLTVLCLVVFVAVFRPNAVSAVAAAGKREHCKTDASAAHWCR